jgi:hypothetical protein
MAFDLTCQCYRLFHEEGTRILHLGEELQMLECNNCQKVVEIIAHTTRGNEAVSLCLDCIKIPLHEFNAKVAA